MGYYSLSSMLFPILNRRNLFKPHPINMANCRELRRVLTEFLDSSSDKDSVYSQIKNSGNFTEEELVVDILTFLMAGHETSSITVISTLYFLHKFPETLSKLKKELENFPVHRGDFDKELYSKLLDCGKV